MPRVIGIDIPGNKRLVISLTYIYGIGKTVSEEIIKKLGLDPNMRAHNLTDDDVSKLNAILQSEYMVEGDLRRTVQNNIKRLINISSYRGLRHRLGLPARGQRTRCNARTRKGKKENCSRQKKSHLT
eukprot:Filipodium_phascolosomae@DN5340_c0_g1_i1.p1